MTYEPVIGLEVHVEMLTQSKMFCACPVVDSTTAAPNAATCPICMGHPGTLPVLNRQAVEFGLRVALALGCEIRPLSIFARKNYFYPDLPKGYQISQYEQPLAVNGKIEINGREIRIRRVHLEEDTGKLTHVDATGSEPPSSLVDLNRAGVPLLEIVTEPDFRSASDVRAYAETLRTLVRYLSVNSGDLEKGVMRIEPNISVRPAGSEPLGTKVEIKNLNSFRALERGVAFEIQRQIAVLQAGGQVTQETVGWDESAQQTYSQRSKEDAHDYRYFPEPDLPPLRVRPAWVKAVARGLPELPWEKSRRLQAEYGLSTAEASRLVAEKPLGEYYEQLVASGPGAARPAFAWLTGEVLSLMNESGLRVDSIPIPPPELAALIKLVAAGAINQNTAKAVLSEMFVTGQPAAQIVADKGLRQVSDVALIESLVAETLAGFPEEVASYRAGKESVANWLFGQVMRRAGGKADPQVVREALVRLLAGE